jgi:hypothetical protein
MSGQEDTGQAITHHIFTVSATMIAVCLTIITIFKVTNVDLMTMADDVLGLDAFIFIISCLMSYVSLRHRNNKTLELIADISFFIGMIIMVIAGAMVIFLTCWPSAWPHSKIADHRPWAGNRATTGFSRGSPMRLPRQGGRGALQVAAPPGRGFMFPMQFDYRILSTLPLPTEEQAVSLGGMRDEADIRGHGFTDEGSKSGATLSPMLFT